MKPRLAITLGDINGVGPEILVKALARKELWEFCEPIVVGSKAVLEPLRASWGSGPVYVNGEDGNVLEDADSWRVPVLECGIDAPPREPGALSADAGRCAVEWLKEAIRMALDGTIDGIVTCPLNKEGIHLAGYDYSGHTEVLAEMTASPDYRMCLFTDRMRIVHISSHCSLRDAIELVKTDRIVKSIQIGHDALVRIGLNRRRIAVAGLNPHAGESGLFGTEEADAIAPAVEECRGEGIDCSGPYPPDTVFRRMFEGEFDLVVSMYHDQGHIPLKLVALDEGVNVTLGIPIVRTSVDHGTAYDIAGTGSAREDSLCRAIELAALLARKE